MAEGAVVAIIVEFSGSKSLHFAEYTPKTHTNDRYISFSAD